MKNPPYICTSNSFNYARAAIARSVKAGFFYSSAKGGFSSPISGGLSLPSPKKGIQARASGLFDGGIWQAAFSCLQTSNSPHHAHRNHAAQSEAANSPAQFRQSRRHPAKDGKTACNHAEAQPRIAQTPATPFPPFTRFTLTPAIPPAAFFSHTFC